MTRPRGFTLIELLVVIAIIAILAAILFPVFARAREKARQTSCLSNVKQLCLGFLMYADDYSEALPPANYYSADYSHEYSWDFCCIWNPDYTLQSYTVGLIGPYTKNAEISKCPSLVGAQSWGRPASGYAVNVTYLCSDVGLGGVALAQVKDPSATVLIADSAYYSGTTLCTNNFLRSPSDAMRNSYMGQSHFGLHFRHNGVANAGYLDGHAKAATRLCNASSPCAEPNCGDLSSDDSAYDLN